MVSKRLWYFFHGCTKLTDLRLYNDSNFTFMYSMDICVKNRNIIYGKNINIAMKHKQPILY